MVCDKARAESLTCCVLCGVGLQAGTCASLTSTTVTRRSGQTPPPPPPTHTTLRCANPVSVSLFRTAHRASRMDVSAPPRICRSAQQALAMQNACSLSALALRARVLDLGDGAERRAGWDAPGARRREGCGRRTAAAA
eukprot:1438399-Rhodomonas_salina.1